MKKNILAVVLGALVVFVWGMISWAALPWHNWTAHQFEDEAAVIQMLESHAPNAGVYWVPYGEGEHEPGKAAAFLNVLPDGWDMNMSKLMIVALLGQILSALIVLLLLRHTSGLNYWAKVRFVALVGLAIGFISHFPYWNWFGFPADYTLVMTLDTLIAWALAGLVMAKFAEVPES